MTKKQCWRYKCDFCGKVGYSSGHMKSHEKHCTANPDRVCRFHKHCENQVQPPMQEMLECLRSCDKDYVAGLKKLREVSSDCPCCILAAIRQSGLQEGCADEDGYTPGVDFGFNFKEEMASKWSDINNDTYEQAHHG